MTRFKKCSFKESFDENKHSPLDYFIEVEEDEIDEEYEWYLRRYAKSDKIQPKLSKQEVKKLIETYGDWNEKGRRNRYTANIRSKLEEIEKKLFW